MRKIQAPQGSYNLVVWHFNTRQAPSVSGRRSAVSGSVKPIFHEEQAFKKAQIRTALATVPTILLGLVIWQVVLGHPWGRHPMSNASLIGWTIFLWLIYWRLITVKLVTDLGADTLSVCMRGFWRAHHIPVAEIEAAQAVSFNAVQEFGGYGIRTIGPKKAYVAAGDRGVSLKMSGGRTIVVGSQRADELAKALSRVVERVRLEKETT